jgi:signal transduction histidine kinase
MNQQEKIQGVALRCNLQGEILEVLQNTFKHPGAFESGKHFMHAVHQGSFPKWLNFQSEIRKEKAVFDWDLFVHMGNRLECLHFSGTILDNDLFLIGAKNRSDLVKLFKKLMPGGKKLLKKLDSDLLEGQGKERSKMSSFKDQDMYDQIAVLYNEMANLQRHLSKKSAELEKMTKRKNYFLGVAAHELRHPLGIIQLLSGLLLEEALSKLTPEQIEYLTMIKTYSESMQGFVDDFLDIAASESGKLHLKKEPSSLLEIFTKNLATNRLVAEEKQVTLQLFHDDKIPIVRVDPSKIEQVLNNLLSNALKSSPEGGRIEIHLRHSGKEIVFKVKDQGSGIDPEDMPRLFEPFEKSAYSHNGSLQGSGLGLAIARKIVDAHEGRIWVESEVNKGSTFFVSLPIEMNPP